MIKTIKSIQTARSCSPEEALKLASEETKTHKFLNKKEMDEALEWLEEACEQIKQEQSTKPASP
jgi:hypothetical protein